MEHPVFAVARHMLNFSQLTISAVAEPNIAAIWEAAIRQEPCFANGLSTKAIHLATGYFA